MQAEDKEIMRRVGRTVRALRLLRGLTQAELGEQCGVSQNHLSNVENGNREVSVALVARVARALRVPPNLIVVAAFEAGQDAGSDSPESLASSMRELLFSVLDDVTPDDGQGVQSP